MNNVRRHMATFTPSIHTFVVEEIPAYRPSGTGEHTYLWIEKKGLTTGEVVRRVARAAGVAERDVGYAGQKDRHATTRQFLSVPGLAPEAALGLTDDGIEVLAAERHGNKLRLGHLEGNRFEVLLQQVTPAEAEGIEARLRQLAHEGLANRFGEQRFGVAGDNVAKALAVLRGERGERDQRRRQFLFSALQSAVFNRALELRAQTGGLLKLRAGDVLQKRQTGGLFITEDLQRDAQRVVLGEVVPTGPLPGNREREPPPGTEARLLEDEAMALVGVRREDLSRLGRALPGARRPVVVPVTPGDPPLSREAMGELRLRFSLPAGTYATVVVDTLLRARNEAGHEAGREAVREAVDEHGDSQQ
jgi:tRNA pseudouridine13 synthase